MDDLVSRQWLLDEYDKRHKGPPGGARKIIEEAPGIDEDYLFPISKESVSRAGYEGRELRFRLFNGRLFAIRELAQ